MKLQQNTLIEHQLILGHPEDRRLTFSVIQMGSSIDEAINSIQAVMKRAYVNCYFPEGEGQMRLNLANCPHMVPFGISEATGLILWTHWMLANNESLRSLEEADFPLSVYEAEAFIPLYEHAASIAMKSIGITVSLDDGIWLASKDAFFYRDCDRSAAIFRVALATILGDQIDLLTPLTICHIEERRRLISELEPFSS